MMKLRYVGEGAFVFGAPARDLTDEDMRRFKLNEVALLRSGLYVPAAAGTESAPPTAPGCETCGQIDLADGVSDAEASLAARALQKRR